MGSLVRAVAPVLFWLAVALSAGCEDGISGQAFPQIEVDPAEVVLPAVPVGESTTKFLRIRNAGGSELIITTLDFSNALDGREFSKEHAELPLRLAGEQEISIPIRYAPLDEDNDEGHLIIESNDARTPTVRVHIYTLESTTDLIAVPPALDFSSDDGEPVRQATAIINRGNVPATLTAVYLADGTDEEFSIVSDVENLPGLALGDEFSIEVLYTPMGGDSDLGTLVVESDSISQPRILIPLEANQPSGEIAVNPEAVAFGAVVLDTDSDVVEVYVENRGTDVLRIDRIGLALSADTELFELHDLPDFPLEMAPVTEMRFSITYHPTRDGRHTTGIAIQSNDLSEPSLTIPVSGRVRAPCIEVVPGQVDLGVVALNIESARPVLQVSNCGDIPLSIEDITIDGEGFSVESEDGMPIAGRQLMPLGTARVRVWFENTNLGEGQVRVGTVTVHNDVPGREEIQVPVTVRGGGAPVCDLVMIPNRVDFGMVARGREAQRTFDIVNTGTGPCELRGQEVVGLIDIMLPGFGTPFALSAGAPVGAIPPGAFVPVEATYAPQIINPLGLPDQGVYRATFFDRFRMEERTTEAMLLAFTGESSIEVIPGRLDFNRVAAGECASREERVTVYSTGAINLCITDIALEGPDCDEFLITRRPVADMNGCILVTRNTPADVFLVYEPTNLGGDRCTLVFESDAENTPELRVPLLGEGVREREQTDEFVQTSGQTVDVLFVVDNSGSMSDEQNNLRDNFGDFIVGAQMFANDYQLGIVTTDMENENQAGRLRGNPRIMRRGGNIEQQFQDTVRVGTNGSGSEKGLGAAEAALSEPLAFDTMVACNGDGDCAAPDRCVAGMCGGFNRGFVREEAALEVVFVSDEDDYSTAPLNYYVDFLKNIKGFRNEGRFHAHAIVGSVNGQARACDTNDGQADAGRKYVDVAQRTNGGVYSICDNDFGVALREIGNRAFGLPVQFFLSRPAIEATIRVQVEGQPRPDGWDYDQNSNSVIFAVAPRPQQTIRVDYEAQCFERSD